MNRYHQTHIVLIGYLIALIIVYIIEKNELLSPSSSSGYYAEAVSETNMALPPTDVESEVITTTSSELIIQGYHLRIYKGIRVTTMDATKATTFTAKSLLHCVVVCMRRPGAKCLSMSFNPKTRVCHVNNLVLSGPGPLVVKLPNFVYAEITERIEWHLAFRAISRIGSSVYDAWENTGHHDNVDIATVDQIGCLTMHGRLRCTKHLRSWRLDDWNKVHQVKHGFYTNAEEVFFVTFDASSISSVDVRDAHFRMSNIVDSSATQLIGYKGEFNFDSIEGHPGTHRRFYLCRWWGNCIDDQTWMYVTEGYDAFGGCPYEDALSYPHFYYTKTTKSANFAGDIGKAQVFAVFLKYRDDD